MIVAMVVLGVVVLVGCLIGSHWRLLDARMANADTIKNLIEETDRLRSILKITQKDSEIFIGQRTLAQGEVLDLKALLAIRSEECAGLREMVRRARMALGDKSIVEDDTHAA